MINWLSQILLPHLAQLRLTAYNENGNLLGQRVLPLEYLRPGRVVLSMMTMITILIE